MDGVLLIVKCRKMLVLSIFFLFRGMESNGRKIISKSNWHDQESNSPPFYLEGILIDATFFFYCIFLLRDLGVIYEEKKELALELDPNKFNFVQTAWIFHSAVIYTGSFKSVDHIKNQHISAPRAV